MNNIQQMISVTEYRKYEQQVYADLHELVSVFPFTRIVYQPFSVPHEIVLQIVAVENVLINHTHAKENDFLGPHSFEVHLLIPYNYREAGCKVFCHRWEDIEKVPPEDLHFHHFDKRNDHLQLCVGVPDSFRKMRNVILESSRTASKILQAYHLFLSGVTASVELLAYSHGYKGLEEYVQNKKRFRP